MAYGKSIRLFLTDGSPSGILTAEIINWTGHVLSAPRSKLKELIQREECARTGIYFLVCDNPEPPFYPKVYIGETDNVAERLKQHNRDEKSGGKDFWEKVCLITSKDQNLTKAHALYLESRLIEIAKQNGQCDLINGNAADPGNKTLPEADIANMEYFLDQIQVILPVLGHQFLKEIKVNQIQNNKPTEQSRSDKVFFVIESAKLEIYARAQEIDGEFVVLEGSTVRKDFSSKSGHSYTQLRSELFKKGIIDSKSYSFQKNYLFSSPSAASGVILSRASNGRKEWKLEGSNLTYAQWQEQQLDEVDIPFD